MAYSSLNFGDAKNQLAAKLGDVGKVFFTDSELGAYIIESLRTFNSAALLFRDRGVFETTAGVAFYDTSLITKDEELLLDRTVTDRNLIDVIVKHLIESVDASYVWTGTTQFSITDITTAIEKARNQFLLDTGQILSVSEINVPSAPVGRVPLSQSIIDVRRAAWLSFDGDGNPQSYTNLWETDEYTLNHQLVGWNINSGKPKAYSVILTPQLTLQLAPVPSDIGKLHLITINTGAAIDASGVLLGVSDDFSPFVKWLALSFLLNKDGEVRDPVRADYCRKRYEEGVQLAEINTSVMNALVNDKAVSISSLEELDSGVPGWQNQAGEPKSLAMAGWNLMALRKVPDDAYGITVDVVRNAIVPTDDTDYLQISPSLEGVLLGYAQHLAAFKMGGPEFQATFGFYEDFFITAAEYNSILKAQADNFDILSDRETEEEKDRPRVAA